MSPSALSGVKVIDLSRVLGGPYCSQILADHGALVVKVEPPQGDETRGWGPPFQDDLSAYFCGANRGKKCLALDLGQPEGREILLRLLRDADVLLENFKPGGLKKWGLDYSSQLQAKFPRLIHCSITGFGEGGPLGGLPGYDAAAQAWTGIMSVNGSEESGSLRMGLPLVDIATGMNAALGILLALYEREKSGQGQSVATSLFETGLSLMHPHAANFLMSGQIGGRTGSAHTNISPYDLFRTKTTPVFLAVGNDRQFVKLCEELGAAALSRDPRFLHNKDRLVNRLALKAELEKLLSTRDGRGFAEEIIHKGVPAGPVLNMKEALEHPQTRALEMVGEEAGYRGVASPVKMSRTPARFSGKPQKFSQSSREILRNAGFSDSEIEKFITQEVVPVAMKPL